MLTPSQKLAIKYRAKLVKSNLKSCHSGADIHQVGNMLNTAEGILQLVDEPDTGEEILELLDRVEKQQVEFFKRKFPPSVIHALSHTETVIQADRVEMDNFKKTVTESDGQQGPSSTS